MSGAVSAVMVLANHGLTHSFPNRNPSENNNRRSGAPIHLINTFNVHDGQAARVAGSLQRFTEEQASRMPHMRELTALVVSVSPVFYDVVYVGNASA